MIRLGADLFEELADEIGFNVENIQHPDCTLEYAGRFYEGAAECLRAHAILRLLIDANPIGFSSDLVMSGHARRAFLRRCRASQFVDGFLAFSRSGSMLDAVAGDDLALGSEIFKLSPTDWQAGDEYEDDFLYQRYLGLELTDASVGERKMILDRLEVAAEGSGSRLAICHALNARDSDSFESAFQSLLKTRFDEIADDEDRADEEVAVAVTAKVFIEGVAVLKLARRANLRVALQYPMCPALALLPQAPAQPADEFSSP